MLSVLIHPHQPAWFLHRLLRVFSLIASRAFFCVGSPRCPDRCQFLDRGGLHKQFLSFPLPEDPEAEAVAKDYSRIPHIESLAAMLINPRFDDDEVRRTTIALRGS